MARFLGRLAAFAAVIAAVLTVLEWSLPFYWGNPVLGTKITYLDRESRWARLDTVFLGSSRTYRHVDPQLFDALVGSTTSFNLGAPATANPELYRIADTLLDDPHRTATIRRLVIELNNVNDIAAENMHTQRLVYGLDWRSLLFAVRYNAARRDYAQVRMYIRTYVDHAMKLGARLNWATAHQRMRAGESRGYLGVKRDGFQALDDAGADAERSEALSRRPAVLEARTRDVLLERRGARPIEVSSADRVHIDRINALVRKAERRGIDLIFVLPPRVVGLYGVFTTINPARRIDLSDPTELADLYDQRYSFDVGHLNAAGARKFTTALARRYVELRRKPVVRQAAS